MKFSIIRLDNEFKKLDSLTDEAKYFHFMDLNSLVTLCGIDLQRISRTLLAEEISETKSPNYCPSCWLAFQQLQN